MFASTVKIGSRCGIIRGFPPGPAYGTDKVASMPRPVVGELLLHPVALTAVAVMIMNDHYAKAHFSGMVTGKVSDFAGLVYFPLLVASLIDAGSRAIRGRAALSQGILVLSVAVTGIVFAFAKTTMLGAEAFRTTWTIINWPLRALMFGYASSCHVHFVADATDLVAVPMLLVAYFVGWRTIKTHKGDSAVTV
jgi:hypothetical protein